ncbi:MAG: hypothetical protein ACYTHJ_03320 [Planctomycetota bacterium]|jgi:hypothetical protein
MTRLAFLITTLAALTPALAHQPTISDGSATSAENAIEFTDIQLSRVVYHEITDSARQVWLTFDIDEPQSLFLSLGIPFIDRLASFRPALVILGPGLPQIELPFAIPEGLGGLEFATDGVSNPEVFDEPFSATTSWILHEEDVNLPEAGTYYIMAYVPSGDNGKLWVAPGTREEFSLAEILELNAVVEEVQAFHEVSPGPFPCYLLPFAGFIMAFPFLRLIHRKYGRHQVGASGILHHPRHAAE